MFYIFGLCVYQKITKLLKTKPLGDKRNSRAIKTFIKKQHQNLQKEKY